MFIDGRLDRTLRGDGLVAEFIDILEDYVARRSRDVAVRPERRPAGRERRVAALRRPPLRVYTPRQLNGRSATWVTPTFLF